MAEIRITVKEIVDSGVSEATAALLLLGLRENAVVERESVLSDEEQELGEIQFVDLDFIR